MRVALVNPNRIKPPISPLGIEYVAEGLLAAGHEVTILDLCWEEQPEKAIPAFFNRQEYGLVGISIRNTDDCSFATRESFLPGFSSTINNLFPRKTALNPAPPAHNRHVSGKPIGSASWHDRMQDSTFGVRI